MAPCLWLSSPKTVIFSGQGKVAAPVARWDGTAACWKSRCFGKPWRCAPSWGGGSSVRRHRPGGHWPPPGEAVKCPQSGKVV